MSRSVTPSSGRISKAHQFAPQGINPAELREKVKAVCVHIFIAVIKEKSKAIYGQFPFGAVLISNSRPSARHQLKLQDQTGLVFRLVACLLPSFRHYQFILLGNRAYECEQLA